MADLKTLNLRKKSPVTVNIYLDISDPDSPMVLSEDEEKELEKKETKGKLPDNIV